MTMRWIAIAALAACGAAGAVQQDSVTEAGELTAEQIVEKNMTARGGLEAWRKVQTMVWVGHMETPGAPVSQVPFVLQQKRPNKTRFELNAMGERTLRVFDGKRGWKVRPGQDGRADVQPFTPQELHFAQSEVVIDSPLFGYDPKRVAMELGGVDRVDGREAYRLILRTPSGDRHNVWVDAKTFLDVKYDRTSYNQAGVPATIEVYYRDYRAVQGLQIPGTIETGVGSRQGTEKLVIEKVALNPPLDDHLFARPGGPHRRAMVTIESDTAQEAAPTPANPPATANPESGSAPK
jgi:hypothetical protein